MSAKNNTPNAAELRGLIDALSEIVENCKKGGFVPTFSVKGGVIGMVAGFRPTQTQGRGRPRKCCAAANEADEVEVEVS